MPHPSPFRYFKTSPEIIRLAVMLYVRYPLSLRNVVLSRICAAPSAHLGHQAFERQGAFPSQC